ncbi:16S rRNA (guanine(527)-N(7))-methyltransferase RsmG [Leptolyngbya sp. FACHB-711]|uniref:16S rRNA (guanine(527)-N(7))-methyltransferase RsmG n=1 Tax=unclassified Leptolyngbya TaxID=2650499 RepID=UPI0016821DC7|nr:16S rRNA (guanine(527)-N(7))-methyltransferase RsmG [Leptolyngbya sp. FACHB-711]MBD1849588.1 16S rRNA (guanine(527)-N(7))-methyltransferase RsmG [Cyanobacteria bacterium FACHB-502]MBD2026937.1 16S rRNA (guanine(527)-N(7))-methyltransferase RsmG [Leptolyngbya sp. FACHB-711]
MSQQESSIEAPHETALPELAEVWQKTIGWQPTPEQQQQFQQLYRAILTGNRQLNLTRITEPQEFWEKHLWDSLRGIQPWICSTDSDANALRAMRSSSPVTVIDIGTGAGFPGVPAAIVCPHWQMTLLDSTRKKIAFIDTLLAHLELPNAKTLVARVEAIGQQSNYRDRYDLALIRAVSAASVCAEYALPLLKQGGTAILYRGQWTDEEQTGLDRALAPLGGKQVFIDAFTTPFTGSVRHCIHIQKEKPTPIEFPRAIGVPTQKPLG